MAARNFESVISSLQSLAAQHLDALDSLYERELRWLSQLDLSARPANGSGALPTPAPAPADPSADEPSDSSEKENSAPAAQSHGYKRKGVAKRALKQQALQAAGDNHRDAGAGDDACSGKRNDDVGVTAAPLSSAKEETVPPTPSPSQQKAPELATTLGTAATVEDFAVGAQAVGPSQDNHRPGSPDSNSPAVVMEMENEAVARADAVLSQLRGTRSSAKKIIHPPSDREIAQSINKVSLDKVSKECQLHQQREERAPSPACPNAALSSAPCSPPESEHKIQPAANVSKGTSAYRPGATEGNVTRNLIPPPPNDCRLNTGSKELHLQLPSSGRGAVASPSVAVSNQTNAFPVPQRSTRSLSKKHSPSPLCYNQCTPQSTVNNVTQPSTSCMTRSSSRHRDTQLQPESTRKVSGSEASPAYHNAIAASPLKPQSSADLANDSPVGGVVQHEPQQTCRTVPTKTPSTAYLSNPVFPSADEGSPMAKRTTRSAKRKYNDKTPLGEINEQLVTTANQTVSCRKKRPVQPEDDFTFAVPTTLSFQAPEPKPFSDVELADSTPRFDAGKIATAELFGNSRGAPAGVDTSSTMEGVGRIVTNMVKGVTSFLPLVRGQQQPAVPPAAGKASVKVKALEAAEAAKKQEEVKQAERAKRLEAAKQRRLLGKNADVSEKLPSQGAATKAPASIVISKDRMRPEPQKKKETIQRHDKPKKAPQIRGMGGATTQELVTATTATALPEAATHLQSTSSWECVPAVLAVGKPESSERDHLEPRADILSYDISPYKSGSDSDEDENEDYRRPKKPIPAWAQTVHLLDALRQQQHTDPDEIFQQKHIRTCNLDEVFAGTYKPVYNRRGSSGNWIADRVTWQEELAYKKSMGFKTFL